MSFKNIGVMLLCFFIGAGLTWMYFPRWEIIPLHILVPAPCGDKTKTQPSGTEYSAYQVLENIVLVDGNGGE